MPSRSFAPSLKILLVVLSVRSNPFDQYNSVLVPRLHHQPIGVALDVENHPVVRQEAGARVPILDVLRPSPMRALNLNPPRVERPAGVRVRSLERFQFREAEKLHRDLPKFPSRGALYIP